MKRRVDLSPLAQQDIADIWRYTADKWGAAKADSYVTELAHALDVLADNPFVERLREEFEPPFRLARRLSHVVAHDFDDDRISVIRILHMRSNWGSVLTE